jgi:hypothetical protein
MMAQAGLWKLQLERCVELRKLSMNDKACHELEQIELQLGELRKYVAIAEAEVNSLKRTHDVSSMWACRLASHEPGGVSGAMLSEIDETSVALKRAQSLLDSLSAKRLSG